MTALFGACRAGLLNGIVAAVAFAALAIAAPGQAQDITLRIANYGGNFTQSQNKYVAERFTKQTGVKVQWIDGNPHDHLQKLIASRGRAAPFDIVYLDDKVQPDAIDIDSVMKIDPKIVTNLAKLYPQALEKDGYGPVMLFWSWGLMYNVKAFRDAGIPEPTSWNDLWDPRLANKLAIADVAGPGGLDFIITAARLAGGDETNFMPGLEKIAQLKPLYYFSSSVDLRSKFAAGDVWVAPWNNGQSNSLIDSGFPGKFIYPKEGGYLHTSTIDVVKGTPYPKEAQMYINFALDPLGQLGQAYEIPYGPTNKALASLLAEYPEFSKKFPASETDLKQLNVPNWKLLNASWPKLVDAWNRRIIRK
jgi:putative spermidine/putrescine transport system substrate-binding protein